MIDVSDVQTIIDQLATGLYIDGKWIHASSGRKIAVINPATEEEITSVDSADSTDVQRAIDAAADAAKDWASRTPRSRSELLRHAYEVLIERKEYFAKIITLEHGKDLTSSLSEVVYAAEFFRWFSEEGVRNHGEYYRSPHTGADIVVHHKPAGIALLITPWNFPLAMGTRKIAPALAAGCTVLVKPASATPLTMLALAQLMEECGIPPGVVNIIPSNQSSQVLPVVFSDARVRVVSFTGSTQIGKTLLKNAAEQVLNCSMELGGNGPFIVTEHADIDAAIEGAMIAKMRNMGESCVAANRFYVHDTVYEEFTAKLAACMGAMKMGNGMDDGVEVGAIINAEARKDIHAFVEDAVQKGAKIVTGGIIPEGKGYFYPPTVVRDVSADARAVNEEIFGPVAPIRRYTGEDAMLEEVNESPDGLASYVYSGDVTQAVRIAKALESGMVGINRGIISDPAAPFGGVKQSGLGREGAHEGLMEFLETQYLSINL